MNTIGWAVKHMQVGYRVRRTGWNGKGMWLAIRNPEQTPEGLPYVFMRTAQGPTGPWLCSQTDLLAADWELAEEPDPVDTTVWERSKAKMSEP